MEVVSNIANGFIGLFNAGGETFMGWVTGIIPLVICLMTAVNAVIGFIGVERVEGYKVYDPSLYITSSYGRHFLNKPSTVYIWTFLKERT